MGASILDSLLGTGKELPLGDFSLPDLGGSQPSQDPAQPQSVPDDPALRREVIRHSMQQKSESNAILNYKAANTAYLDAFHVAKAMGILDEVKDKFAPFASRNTQIIFPMAPPQDPPQAPPPTPTPTPPQPQPQPQGQVQSPQQPVGPVDAPAPKNSLLRTAALWTAMATTGGVAAGGTNAIINWLSSPPAATSSDDTQVPGETETDELNPIVGAEVS